LEASQPVRGRADRFIEEGVNGGIMSTKIEWIPIKEAWFIATGNAIDVSLNQFRSWVNNKKYGIISGKFGARLVVRKDTIPTVLV